jgi:DNA-binding helix-hairpin-helix protein with protein kinase domain
MKVVIRNGPQKSPCELGKLIAQGGAGAIYLVKGHPQWVAKIYMHPNSTQINHQAATHERERIEAMLGRPPQIKAPHLGRYHQLAWPLGIIETPAGQALGFTMSKLPLDKACDLESLITKSGRAAEGLPEDYIVRLFAAHNIAALVRELHREGHYIVDMKPKNMSIYKTNEAQGLVAILDSDGFSINSTNGKRFPAEMFSSEYIAPELLKQFQAGPSRRKSGSVGAGCHHFSPAQQLHPSLLGRVPWPRLPRFRRPCQIRPLCLRSKSPP